MQKFVVTIGLVTLTACTNGGNDPVYTAFHRESGAIIDNGDFGNATMSNTLVQSGQRDYVVDLGKRFASEVPSTVTFAFNSATLDGAARATLSKQAAWIQQFPEIQFTVYGYTDAVGSTAYNKRLGLRRAQAVVSYFASQGIDRKRLKAVTSFGETQPLIATNDRERRNRRTVTEVSGFVKNHPSVLNGKYAEVVFRKYVESATARREIEGISGAELSTDQ